MEKEEVVETERTSLATRLNWLRAGVLGANDGIVSTAGLVVGVSGAAVGRPALLAAGLAGLAGADDEGTADALDAAGAFLGPVYPLLNLARVFPV